MTHNGSELSYEEFGVRFIELAVTSERIAEAIAELAGSTVEVGPINAGPADLASVKARGSVGTPSVKRTSPNGARLEFEALLPISLELSVGLGATRHQFSGDVTVTLRLDVVTSEPLVLVIEVDRVDSADVSAAIAASSPAGKLLARLGNMDAEVRRQVAAVVNERIGSDAAVEARTIDIAGMIDQVWSP